MCYQPFTTQESNSPATYGTHNTWGGPQNASVNDVSSINVITNLDQRKWVASFDADGLKVKGSALPITANVTKSN